MTARLKSLLEWVGVLAGTASSPEVKELFSGELLADGLSHVIPELAGEESEPWKALLRALEGFCGCTLQKTISLDQIRAGDEENAARALVLLLCMAVEQKNNEAAISAITALDMRSQRDLKFFIEETMGQLNSHAILAGTFTSGVGCPLPPLQLDDEEKISPPIPPPPFPPVSHPPTLSSSPLLTITPKKPSKAPSWDQRFYDGLCSPAAVKWLKSPAISRTNSRTPHVNRSDGLRDDMLKLQHRLRVVEKALESERSLAYEFYSDLTTRNSELEELKTKYAKAQSSLEQLRGLEDLRDELAQCQEDLVKAEATIARYKSKVEKVEKERDKSSALAEEQNIRDLEAMTAESEYLKKKLDQTTNVVLEQEMELKKLQLSLDTTQTELWAKASEVESLKAQSKEELEDLQRQIVLASEEEKRSMGELAALKAEIADIKTEKNSITTKYTDALKEIERTHQSHALQLESLSSRSKVVQSQQEQTCRELTERNLEMAKKQTQLHEEIGGLREMLEKATALNEKYKSELKEAESEADEVRREVNEKARREVEEARRESEEMRREAGKARRAMEEARREVEELRTYGEQMRAKDFTEADELAADNEQLQLEVSQLRKSLLKERQANLRVTNENRTLEAQLNLASQKLRNLERRKLQMEPTSSSDSRAGLVTQEFFTRSYEPRTNEEEFYDSIHQDFGSGLPPELEEPPDDFSFPSSNFPRERATIVVTPSHCVSLKRNHLATVAENEGGEKNEKVRLTELQRRNAQALPHLKSSYPIEMQVCPESPSVSDDRVKYGSRKQSRSETATSFADSSFSAQNDCKRKRTGNEPGYLHSALMRSPLPSQRRTSAPPTPQSQSQGNSSWRTSEVATDRRFTMASSSTSLTGLREYLDRSNKQDEMSVAQETVIPPRQSAAFEVAFSPPKTRGVIPKRLQEKRAKATRSSSRIATAVSSAEPHTSPGKASGRPHTAVRGRTTAAGGRAERPSTVSTVSRPSSRPLSTTSTVSRPSSSRSRTVAKSKK